MSGQQPGPDEQGTPERDPYAQQPSGQGEQPPAYGQPQPPAYGQQQPPAYGQPQPPAYGQQQPAYGQAPAYAGGNPYGPPTASVPGKTLGIVGFVLAFVMPLVGMIISIVALVQSKKAGRKNALALWGIIVGAVLTVLIVVGVIMLFAVAGDAIQTCLDNPSGTYVVDGTTYSCGG